MAKTLRGPVGRCADQPSVPDVMTVQYLLNCVPADRGGAVPELSVDGITSRETLAAIVRFQVAAGLPVDGRVEPGSKTLARLQPFDPLPEQVLTGPVPSQQYNPKELGVDKMVPWRR